MEGGVEARHRGHAGQRTADRRDAGQRDRLVQRSEIGQLGQRCDDAIVDAHRLAKALAPVHDAMPDGIWRGHRGDRGLQRVDVIGRDVGRGLDRVVGAEQPQLQAARARVDDEDTHLDG